MRFALVLASAGLLAAGCGEGDALEVPELLPVEGKVTLDGEPLGGAQVMFLPKGRTAGQGAYAATGSDGRFSLKYINDQEGCPAGEYSVLISKLVTPDGGPIPEGQTAADVAAIDVIPPRYKDPEAPMNSITIMEAKADLNFELKSK